MPLLFRKKGLAAKLEATYGVNPTIAVADDSIQHTNLQVTPLDGDFVNRNLDRSTLGAEGDILVSSRTLMSLGVEAAGAGAAGDAPPWAQLLRACGFAETLDAGVDAEYNPISGAFESLWLEGNLDGNSHIAKGAAGNLSFDWTTKNIPLFNFAFTGLYEDPAAVVAPVYDKSDFLVPEAFNNANTVSASLQGETIALESISLDLQNQIEHRDVVGDERVIIVDRDVRGTISFEMPLISAKDWFDVVRQRTSGALSLVHGDTAGNIIEITAPQVELSNPSYSDSQGILMLNLDMILKPAAGNDELRFTIK